MSKTVKITDEQISAIEQLIGYCSDKSEFNCFLTCLLENMDLEKYGVTEEDTYNWTELDDIPKEVLADAPNTVYKEAMIAQEFLNNMATDKQQEDYTSSGGQGCPNCGSKDIVACGFDQANKDGWQKIECEGCCATWTDQYKLTGFTDLKIDED